jgi:transposase
MSSWALQAAEKCEPLIELCLAKLREGDVINMDETPVQVLKEPGRKDTSKSYMWVACGGHDKKRIVLFHYAPSRAGAVATAMLGEFKGFLQTDGYAGYTAIGEHPDITHVGCLVHVRRKFKDAFKAGSKKKKKGTASTVVDLIGKVYHHESQARKGHFSPEAIMVMREEKVKPLLDKIKTLLEESVDAVPPTSLLGKAISYSLGQWARIEAYLQDPRLTPDNNIAENAIRPFAVGRKNWLFSGSPRGAKASATLYSLIETAKANGLDPFEYLSRVFECLPHVAGGEDLQALLP